MNLIRIGIEDARKLWQMQTEAFQDLYKKYQDTENSPAAENIDKTIMRLQQPFTYYYFIQEFDENVGAVRVVDKGEKDTDKDLQDLKKFLNATIRYIEYQLTILDAQNLVDPL